jgi:polysaccharide biosynthesis protein PslH
MKMLLLSPYPPYPPRSGGALRIYNLLVGLARYHEIWLLTFAPDAAAAAALAPLRDHCHLHTVPGPPPRSLLRRAWTTLFSPLPDMALRNAASAYTAALRHLLHTYDIDIVQAESIEMARYGQDARLVGEQRGKRSPRLVLDEFNAEYVLQRRAALNDLAAIRQGISHVGPWLRDPRRARLVLAAPYSLVQWYRLAAYETWLLKTYQHVIAVSEEDRTALQRLVPQARVSVVPNGVDTRYFSREAGRDASNAPSRGKTLVFTGTLDFRPNVDAVTWFAQEVLPLIRVRHPEARFVVVGRRPAPAVQALHDGDTIDVVGEVADVRPAIAGAAVYVVPMRIGGGIRLKLLEALAMEAPVVCTTMGAEGVGGLRDGTHVLLADTPHQFAAATVRVLDNPALAAQMGTAGRRFVGQYYDWSVIVPLLEAVYVG